MNVNFGLFPPIAGSSKGKERKQAMAARALDDFDRWLNPSLDKLAQAPAAA
jgi:methylenetetrahydrofolate--tRNA-(uracil-5-)-methyltransferase